MRGSDFGGDYGNFGGGGGAGGLGGHYETVTRPYYQSSYVVDDESGKSCYKGSMWVDRKELAWVNDKQGQEDRHSTANDLWNITMGGAGTLADVTSDGIHNSIYWVQKNGKVTLTKNIGNNYLLKRSNRIVGEILQDGKIVSKSLTQLNIAYSATDYALTWATTGMPTFGQGMDLFFTSVSAIPGAGWAVSGGYWVISSGSYAITGKWMSEHMDNWVY